ncbi:Choline-glycine betaine transporter [Corynebacterium resistens DSM 45100]|uniref:Choline-glycine betaine transporter n=1 Tax=Corynebacterium resistens (strain DSM 45100 / JCM 12819 / GTC 2026 / SICGH 158) TaxID=662755 RepID=F8DZC8_CORRG|nr:BCCT family transporter [Corynebacterium resistens]AEI09022.1 Choline-glycine betaine transporter [Corynebacterium resistens DSM 45100]
MSRRQTNAAVSKSTAVPGHEFRNPDSKKGSSDPLIFGVSVGFIALFVIGTIVFKSKARDFFSAIAGWLLENFNWMYVGGVSIVFLFLIGLFVSHFGRMRLGGDGEQPEHSTVSWFAMLFAGGIGSVLMFFGVAEPLNHVLNVPMQDAEPLSREAINEAMGFTMYHFGIHMWVIFTLPGLAMGYFIYKRHLPPRISSIFAPVLGAKIYEWPGKLIDALAIIGTVFGIAVSVGLGALQINAGLAHIFGAPTVAWVQVIVIAIICAVACVSVASGLNKGIKILSNTNILMAVVLMIFILATGPTLLLLRGTMDTASIYAEYLPKIMFWSDSQDVNPGWQGKWTVFYWGWTICWSPFVGMFLARISRGRTVREFIGGVLALPTIFALVWFSVFGFAGLDIEKKQPGSLSGPVVREGDTAFALFGFLEHFPWVLPVSVFALAIVAIFFVTSIDSAAMITDMFAAGEENKTPTLYRILWAVLIGAVAAAILVMAPDDGISTLQEVVIIIGLPFFLINFIMMYSLLRGMHDDYAARPEPVTRQWGRTDSAEKLEEHESRPAPGYDDEGNELPRFEFDEDGNLVIPGNVRIQGNLGVDGDVDEDPEPVKEKPQYNQDGDLVDDEGRLINEEGDLVDEEGNRVDENGVPIDGHGNPVRLAEDERN